MNVGKEFEQDYKKSVPDDILLYRLKDSAQSFNGRKNGKIRFSSKSPFDYIMWDSQAKILYALELKTVKGKSISFERTKDDKREIHYHQIQNLNEWAKFDVESGLVIEFRQIATTIYLPIGEYNKLIGLIDKCSFNYDDIVNNVQYLIIPQMLKRTRYCYDIGYFVRAIRKKRSVQK